MDKKPRNTELIIQRIVLIFFSLGVISLITFAGVSIYFLSPVDASNDEYIEFVVQEGWSKKQVAVELDNSGIIRNAFFFQVYLKMNEKEIYAGTYNLSKSMSVYDIIKVLNSNNSLENETLTITFIEGKRLTNYVSRMADTYGFSEDEIMDKLTDEAFIDSLIEKYWFITEEVKKSELYYALEGYLFPDTYIIKKSATVEDVIYKMLSTMENKLNIYKEEIEASSLKIHELLTLASIVELEGAVAEDRAGVAGVFYNRLKTGMTLGSDVTTYYAVKKDFNVDLSNSDLNKCNPYNTRGVCAVPGLPIGPIASPSLASISATIEPAEHDYLYFVADKNKKIYYSKTLSEHEKIIRDLKNQGLWFVY